MRSRKWSLFFLLYSWCDVNRIDHLCSSGVLYLRDHGEEYVFTFPSAYARSILTVPWVELGG
uniref:Secreted protein n=1 Tax=Cyprinus carpio TaxID=7962 RepID=A0A8C2JIC6_CYPCA